jgi:hypothetical protein
VLPSGERELSKAHFGSTVPGKTQRILEVLSPENRLSRASATAFWKYWPNFTFFYFSGYSTSILLFFRSTESPGKTRSVFTPPLNMVGANCQLCRVSENTEYIFPPGVAKSLLDELGAYIMDHRYH